MEGSMADSGPPRQACPPARRKGLISLDFCDSPPFMLEEYAEAVPAPRPGDQRSILPKRID
jgi:hypothetical protein